MTTEMRQLFLVSCTKELGAFSVCDAKQNGAEAFRAVSKT
jgi:hypothetical protein